MTWTQVGPDIDGDATDDELGYSVSLSSDGTRVAVGAPGNLDDGGHVRIFDWLESAWVQVAHLEGVAAGGQYGQFGRSVALGTNGTRVAIGGGTGDYPGYTRIFESSLLAPAVAPSSGVTVVPPAPAVIVESPVLVEALLTQSVFVATTVSTVAITAVEQSDFFSSTQLPSDYNVILQFDLNRWFNGVDAATPALTLGGFPITDGDTGTDTAPQGTSLGGSLVVDWATQLNLLKTAGHVVTGAPATGWGDITDGSRTFKNRMVDVLNSLFGTTTSTVDVDGLVTHQGNTRPLDETKIQDWLETSFAAQVFTSDQFTSLRAMIVHAGKFDRNTGALQLVPSDKMGVIVEISTHDTNMITMNFFLEQKNL